MRAIYWGIATIALAGVTAVGTTHSMFLGAVMLLVTLVVGGIGLTRSQRGETAGQEAAYRRLGMWIIWLGVALALVMYTIVYFMRVV